MGLEPGFATITLSEKDFPGPKIGLKYARVAGSVGFECAGRTLKPPKPRAKLVPVNRNSAAAAAASRLKPRFGLGGLVEARFEVLVMVIVFMGR